MVPMAPGATSDVVWTFHLPTMDCAACATHVEAALRKLPGVRWVNVDLVERTVRVSSGSPDGEEMARALRKAGYPPQSVGAARDRALTTSFWDLPGARRTAVAGALWIAGLLLSLVPGMPTLAELWRWHITPAALLEILAAVLGALSFAPAVLRAGRILRLDIDVLMTIAIVGATVLGDFPEAAAIGVLFSLAELLEGRSMARARDAIHQLVALAPPMATVRRGDSTTTVAVDDIALGETVVVRPGERIPLDGTVTRGTSDVNEAALTGEPMPARKAEGDEVFAGTLSVDGYLEFRVTRAADDTVLARVVELVRAAQAKKARIERFVHRFARIYTPAVVTLALLLAVVPPVVLGASWATWVLRGLTLLVVSCPCALVISTPVSVTSAITSAARHGVVITGGQHLEALGEVRALAFDKTGTLTHGSPQVSGIVGRAGMDAGELIRIAAAVERHSSHPLARAVIAEAARRHVAPGELAAADAEQIPGRGIAATVDGARYRIVVAAGELPAEAEAMRREGSTLVQVERVDRTAGREVLGFIGFADTVRAEARAVVAELRAMGFDDIAMLTGDHEQAARRVAAAVGIADVRAGCLPADKLDAIGRLRSRHGGVAMVGDGINDAPALAAATVGVAMGAAASPTALEAADVALMADDLRMVPFLIRLSRATRRVIRQNIWVSLGVKALMIVGVPLGLVSMTMAVLVGDMGTSLAVTSNALRLGRMRLHLR